VHEDFDFDGEAKMKTLQEVHDMLVLTGYKEEADVVKHAMQKAKRYDYLTLQHGDYCITDSMENTSGVYKAGAADSVIDEAMES